MVVWRTKRHVGLVVVVRTALFNTMFLRLSPLCHPYLSNTVFNVQLFVHARE